MAYQNPGVPRFYINDLSYAKSIGINVRNLPDPVLYASQYPFYGDFVGDENYYNLIDDDPTNLMIYDTETTGKRETWFRYKTVDRGELNFPNYMALLNHNFASAKVIVRKNSRKKELAEGETNTYYSNGYSLLGEIVNAHHRDEALWGGSYSGWGSPLFDGFSIYELKNGSEDGYNGIHDIQFYMNDDTFGNETHDNGARTVIQVGALFIGRYYDMPHSPELDITMTIENDGFDSITSSGGKHLTNIKYNGAPMWEREEFYHRTAPTDFDPTIKYEGVIHPPWSVKNHNPGYGDPMPPNNVRRGRRVWAMNFKHLSSQDLFASNYMSNTYVQDGDHSSNDDYNTNDDLVTDRSAFEYTLEDDDSFVAQVLNKVGNGQRFIFQPDNTNNNPDQFAICQLDQDSLNIKQVANGVYDISLKITEVW